MTVVAAFDCGTNSTRVVVADGDDVLTRRETVTGLGRGTDGSARLSPEGMEATLAALRRYADEADELGATERRVVATQAVREAADAAAFVSAVVDVVGVAPVVLSGRAEGELTYAGVTATHGRPGAAHLVVDIGGGSTELAWGRDGPQVTRSEPMGSVRFTEQFIQHDPPQPEELSALLSVVALHLDDVVRDHPEVRDIDVALGAAGTITTAAAVEIGLDPYDPGGIDGFVLTRDAAEDVFRTLATERLADRVHNPGLRPERGDVIVAGCAILVGVLRYLDLDEMVVSERDLLDGIVAATHWPPEPS